MRRAARMTNTDVAKSIEYRLIGQDVIADDQIVTRLFVRIVHHRLAVELQSNSATRCVPSLCCARLAGDHSNRPPRADLSEPSAKPPAPPFRGAVRLRAPRSPWRCRLECSGFLPGERV